MFHHKPVRTKPFRNTSEAPTWEVLPHEAYSLDLTASDYHLFVSMGRALVEQRFGSYEDVKKWFENDSYQTGVVSTNCPKDAKNV